MANEADTGSGAGGVGSLVSGADVVRYAQSFLGVPYVWGGTSPQGVDCSGLVKLVFQHFGINTPRTTYDMVGPGSNLQPVGRDQLGVGDLLMSRWPGESRPSSHVAIYAGNNTVIEAPQPGTTVTTTKLSDSYWSHVDKILHVPGVDSGGPTTSGSLNPLQALAGVGADVAGNVLGPLAGWIPNPANLTQAVTNLGTAASGIANAAAETGQLAGLAARLFLPSNLLRGALLAAGITFVLIGILFLAKEVSD